MSTNDYAEDLRALNERYFAEYNTLHRKYSQLQIDQRFRTKLQSALDNGTSGFVPIFGPNVKIPVVPLGSAPVDFNHVILPIEVGRLLELIPRSDTKK